MPFACQMLQGLTGKSGDSAWSQKGRSTVPTQVSAAIAPGGPKLPKLMAWEARFRQANAN